MLPYSERVKEREKKPDLKPYLGLPIALIVIYLCMLSGCVSGNAYHKVRVGQKPETGIELKVHFMGVTNK